jgi:hypothetical protein
MSKVWKKEWAEEDMQAALATLRDRDNKESLRAVAIRYGVDHSTLCRRRAEGEKKSTHKLPHRPGPPTMLSIEQEERVLKEMTQIQEGGFQTGAITNARVAEIAFEQSKESRAPLAAIPGHNWVRGFKKRYADKLKTQVENKQGCSSTIMECR